MGNRREENRLLFLLLVFQFLNPGDIIQYDNELFLFIDYLRLYLQVLLRVASLKHMVLVMTCPQILQEQKF